MRYLRKSYSYANQGNYPAGANPWSGQPRLIVPTDSDLANGATPDTPYCAEKENGRLNMISDAHYVQLHSGLQSWFAVTLPQVGTDTYVKAVPMRRVRAFGTMGEAERQIILIGYDASDSNKVRLCTSNDGSKTNATSVKHTIAGPFTGPTGAYAGAAGEIILTNGGTLFTYSANSGSSFVAASTPFSGPPGIVAAHYSSGLGKYFLANDNTSGNAAIGFNTTLAGLISSVTAVNVPITAASKLVDGQTEFADNGTVIMLAAKDNAGNPNIYRSTNGGTTWTLSLTDPSLTGNVNITYSEYYGLFIAWFESGQIATSSDGAVWAQIATGRTPAQGYNTGRDTLKAVGPAIIKITHTGSSTGIVYSLDLCTTWYYWYFNDGQGANATMQFSSANGRLYSTDGKSVFRCLPLAAPSLSEN